MTVLHFENNTESAIATFIIKESINVIDEAIDGKIQLKKVETLKKTLDLGKERCISYTTLDEDKCNEIISTILEHARMPVMIGTGLDKVATSIKVTLDRLFDEV